MKDILLATTNKDKIKELIPVLETKFHVLTLHDFPPMEDCPETGNTYKENAIQKATFYINRTGIPTISDDSGMEVFSLNNKPGIFSARWYDKNHKNVEGNNRKLIEELHKKNLSESRGKYTTTVVYKDGETRITDSFDIFGIVKDTPKGIYGFDYDFYFYPDKFDNVKSMAELTEQERQMVSARCNALKKLIKKL